MSYIGDFAAGDTIDFKFTTRRFSSGATYTLGGTPALSVYKSNSTTQSTAGITLTADFDAVTGLNHVRIDTTSDGTFYADGSQFDVVITTGTVDSVSVVGEVVGRFTLRAQASLYPTTAGRKLDVSAGGEAGVDWANVGSPTTSLNLSGTTISTSQAVASVSGAVGSVTGNVGGNVTGSVGSVVGAVGSVTGAVGSVTAGVTVTTNNDKTGYALTSGERTSVADALLNRDMSAVTVTNSRSPINALRALRNKVSVTAGTVYAEDDATAAWTFTTTVDAAQSPITVIDPA